MEEKLSELELGGKRVLMRVSGSGAIKRRLLNAGSVKGTELTSPHR